VATVATLVTQLVADPAPLDAGFARGLSSVRAFADSASKFLSTPPRNAQGQFAKFGVDTAQSFLGSLQQTFESRSSVLVESLARGSLSPAKFQRLAQDDAVAFNQVLLNTISSLGSRGLLTPEIRQTLVSGLKQAGIESGEGFANGLEAISHKLKSLGRDFVQFGLEWSLIITAPLVAGAHKASDAADQISHAIDKIAVSTGAVGPQMDGLAQSFDTLFRTVAATGGASDIATALSSLSIAAGATGPQLEKLATQALNLSRITGTELKGNIDSTQHAFHAWGVTLDEQATSMDTLFKISQRTGVSVSTIAESLGHFAPALRQFGLSFTQSAALIGQFSKAGIDADATLTALQTSLARFAQKGVTGPDAFQKLIDELKSAGSAAEATDLASRIFGPRAAAQLSDAIRNGTLDIQALTTAVRASQTTINKTAADTDAFGQATGRISQQAKLAASSIGETLQRTLVQLEPAITSTLHAIESFAHAISLLPPEVTTAVIALLALAAFLGPFAIAVGGVARAFGAVGLAIGLLRGFVGGGVLSALGAETAAVGSAAEGAAVGVGLLETGLLALGRLTIVGLTLTGLKLLFDALNDSARHGQETLADFRQTVASMSQVQIKGNADNLNAELTHAQEHLHKLQDELAQQDALGNQHQLIPHSTATVEQLRDLDRTKLTIQDLEASLGILTEQYVKNDAAANASSSAASDFERAVRSLITTMGHGLTIDEHGQISGKLTDLQALANKLDEQLHSTVVIPGFDTSAAHEALERLQVAIRQTQNLTTPKLSSIFDQLSPDLVQTQKQVDALLAHLATIPRGFQQLNDVRLGQTILSDLSTLTTRLRGIKDIGSEDALALEKMIAQLQNTLPAAIAKNTTGSGTFTIDVEGHVKRISVDESAGANLLEQVRGQLNAVHDAAEASAAADLNLTTALATHNNELVARATATAEHAAAAAKRAQDEYTSAVVATGASADQTKAAIDSMLKTVAETGANQQNIAAAHIAFSALDPGEVRRVHDDLQAALQRFGDIAIKVVPVEDRAALAHLATEVSETMQRATLESLAGNVSASAIDTAKSLDVVAQKVQQIAQSGRSAASPAAAMQVIEQFAKEAGIPLQQVQDYLFRISALGQQKQSGLLSQLAGDATSAAAAQEAFVDRVALDIQRLASAAKAGQAGAFEQLQQELKDTGLSVQDVAKAIDDMSTSTHVRQIADEFQTATNAILGTDSAISKLIGSLASGVNAAIDLGKAIAKIHAAQELAAKEAANVSNDINRLSNAGQGGTANTFSGQLGTVSAIAGIVGSLVSIGSALFGQTALEREHDQIAKDNTQALRDLKTSVDRDANAASRVGDIAHAINQAASDIARSGLGSVGATGLSGDPAFDAAIAKLAGSFNATDPTRLQKAGLEAVLGEFHLTMDQVLAEAKALNITLFDSKGNLVGLQAFVDALKIDTDLLTSLGHDLATNQKLISVTNSLKGIEETPAQQLQDSVSALVQTLGPRSNLAETLKNAAAAGPDALRQALLGIVQTIEDGKITLDQLGGFGNATDLLDAIGGTADALHSLKSATDSVVASMTNVPEIFKKAAREFQSTLPEQQPTTIKPPETLPTPLPPLDPFKLFGPLALTPPQGGLREPLVPLETTARALADAVKPPTDALAELAVSASDVAKQLDAMFHVERSGTDALGTTGGAAGFSRALRDVFADARSSLRDRTSSTGQGGTEQHFHIHGDVLVDARDKPAAEITRTITKQLQLRARQLTGDSTRVLDALKE
jgi:TP901 family phage tail tape measure protein